MMVKRSPTLPRWLFRAESSAPSLPRRVFRAESSALALPRANFFLILSAVALLALAPAAATAGRGGPVAAGRPIVQCPTSNVPPVTLAFVIAEALARNPTEDNPVLIQLAPGIYTVDCVNSLGNEFTWRVRLRHIYFSGAGPEFTRIVCDRIIVDPDAITGFRDLYLDAVVELGDAFLPVHNVQVREVEMRNGQLDGVWRDAAGAVHLSRFSAETGRRDEWPRRHEDTKGDQSDGHAERGGPASNVECRTSFLAAPDSDATNTFVLKTGDKMTGPLRIEHYSPAEKLVLSPLAGSSNIVADFRIESSDGTNFGLHIMFRRTSNETYRTVDGIWFWSGGRQGLGVYSNYVSANYLPIKHVWPVSETYDAANKWYVDTQVGTRVSSVSAGDGLSGGGGPGAVTLHVNPGDGIAIVADTVTADGSLLRTGTAAQTYLTIADGATRVMLHGATNALDLLVSTNYLPALSNWAIGYVDGVLTNGQSIVVFIATNQLQVISNHFYFYGDLILFSNQIYGLGWPLSNDNAATKWYVDTQDAALSNALVRMQRGFVFSGQTNEWLCESAQNVQPSGSSPVATYQSVRSAADGVLHVIEVYVGKNPAPPMLIVREGENVFSEILCMAAADGEPRDGWQRYVCSLPVPIAVGQQFCFGADKGTFPAVDVRMTRGYPRGRAYVKPVFPSPGGWDDNYDLAFYVWLQQTRETHSVRVDEQGIAVSNAAFTIDGQDIDARYVNSTGDMMLGDLRFTNNCRIAAEVRGGYASHSTLASVAGIAGGYQMAATNLIVAYATNGYSGTAVIKLHPYTAGVVGSNAFVDMSGAPVRNVGTPSLPSDAATKNYVDTKQFGTANIANYAVTADKLANGAVTSAKLAQMGAASGQVLKWNGNAWAPAVDASGLSEAEGDARYVNVSGDTMTGTLTVPQLLVAGNWAIGSPGNAQIVRVGNNAAGSVPSGWTNSRTVTHNLNISGNYIVIITPTSQAAAPYYVSGKTANSFTVTSTLGFAFDYLIIGRQ